LSAQLSAVRIGSMRYDDQTWVTGRSMNGDTYRCSSKVGAYHYCTYNDGDGPGSGNRNIGFVRLSLDLSDVNATSMTLIDSTSGYGPSNKSDLNGWSNGATNKSGGLDFRDGKLYLQVQQQCHDESGGVCAGLSTPGSGVNSTIIVSDDATIASPNHWCNPKTWAAAGNTCPHNATTAAGDPPLGPTADTAIMWPGGSHMADMQPVQYTAGDKTDGNATTCYWISRSSDFANYYLSKVACASIMDVTAWAYYTGAIGGDVGTSGNWCDTSYSACAASHTAIAAGDYPTDVGGVGWTASMVHLPTPWSTYLLVGSKLNGSGTFNQSLFRSPFLTGPFTRITTDAVLGAGAGQNFPQILLDTLVGSTISVISGGANGSGADYSPYWSTYQITKSRRPPR
jgi:hypothetical protein